MAVSLPSRPPALVAPLATPSEPPANAGALPQLEKRRVAITSRSGALSLAVLLALPTHFTARRLHKGQSGIPFHGLSLSSPTSAPLIPCSSTPLDSRFDARMSTRNASSQFGIACGFVTSPCLVRLRFVFAWGMASHPQQFRRHGALRGKIAAVMRLRSLETACFDLRLRTLLLRKSRSARVPCIVPVHSSSSNRFCSVRHDAVGRSSAKNVADRLIDAAGPPDVQSSCGMSFELRHIRKPQLRSQSNTALDASIRGSPHISPGLRRGLRVDRLGSGSGSVSVRIWRDAFGCTFLAL